MLTKKLLTMAVVVTVATVATPSFAKGGPGASPADVFLGPPPFLAALDADGDGKISRAERQAGQAIIKAARAEEFKTIDTDQDGYLTLAELKAWSDGKITTRFTTLDNDTSGALSVEEFTSGKTGKAAVKLQRLFKLIDTDADGALSMDEFTVVATQAANPLFHFAHLDTDGDGKVSEAEYTTPPRRHGPGQGGPRPGPSQ
jgi:Ca2+-binding EF-hand superfamily protein